MTLSTFLRAALGSLLFIIIVGLAPRLMLMDFSIYCQAVSAFINGENPYALRPQDSYLVGDIGLVEPTQIILQVWAPPWSLVHLIPFGFLPLAGAKILYCLLFILGLALSAYQQQISLKRLFLLFPYGVFVQGLAWGNVSFLLLYSIILALYLSGRHKPLAAFFTLALSCFKPQLLLGFGLVHFLKAWNKSIWNTFLLTGLALLLVLGLSFVLSPLSYEYFFMLDKTIPLSAYTATLSGFLKLLGIPTLVGFTCTSVFLLLILIRRKPIGEKSLLPWSIVLAPYAWGHDYILAAPFLFSLKPSTVGWGILALYQISHLVLFLCWPYASWIFIESGFLLLMLTLPICQARHNKDPHPLTKPQH